MSEASHTGAQGGGNGPWDVSCLPAAIWSTDPEMMLRFPARYFIEFLNNHGLLNIKDRPLWRVIRGGSREYVKKLVRPFENSIRLGSGVTRVRRFADHVEIVTDRGHRETFDAVFLACHSDQALALLEDPAPRERALLGAVPYQSNRVLLHRDPSLMPRQRRVWSSWNYLSDTRQDAGRAGEPVIAMEPWDAGRYGTGRFDGGRYRERLAELWILQQQGQFLREAGRIAGDRRPRAELAG